MKTEVILVEGESRFFNGRNNTDLTKKMRDAIDAVMAKAERIVNVFSEVEFPTNSTGGRALIVIVYEPKAAVKETPKEEPKGLEPERAPKKKNDSK